MNNLKTLEQEFASLQPISITGEVVAVRGGLIEIAGLGGLAKIGQMVEFEDTGAMRGEVIGFGQGRAHIMMHGNADNIHPRHRARLVRGDDIRPTDDWIGKVVDAFGRSWEGEELDRGEEVRSLRGAPPIAVTRKRVGPRISTGYHVFNSFLPICSGQRLGLFAGSGVGKSSLLAGLARNMAADVVVIGLIGERGKEVNEFLHDALGEEGRKRSVVVVATSDAPPLVKRRAAWLTLTIAEYFRDQNKQVLCLMDSLTRFAEAHREVGLAAGEPPSMRAFPPSTFSELSSLVERAGPGPEGVGDITALFTVLVQGSDMDEPVADAVRGFLDGHVVLTRAIAERGRYPAVDVLKSVSRALPRAASDDENALLLEARKMLAAYEDIEPILKLGAYQDGANPEVDHAVNLFPSLDAFISGRDAASTDESFALLKEILHSSEEDAPSEQGKQQPGR